MPCLIPLALVLLAALALTRAGLIHKRVQVSTNTVWTGDSALAIGIFSLIISILILGGLLFTLYRVYFP